MRFSGDFFKPKLPDDYSKIGIYQNWALWNHHLSKCKQTKFLIKNQLIIKVNNFIII